MKFETDGHCFVCGKKNAGGLRLDFKIDKEKKALETTFTAAPVYQGWDGVVHGGIVSTILDESMAKLVHGLGYEAVTASLEVRFLKPAPIQEPLTACGEIVEIGKRLIRAKSRLLRADGTVLATGASTLIIWGNKK